MRNLVGAPTTAVSIPFVLAALLACGGESKSVASGASGVVAPLAPSVSSASITADVDTIVVGQRAKLALIARAATGAVLAPQAIAWATTDSALVGFASPTASTPLTAGVRGANVGEVSVVAIAPGTATVTAIADGHPASVRLVIEAPPPVVASAEIRPSLDTVVTGRLVRFTLVARDEHGATLAARTIRWSTIDSSVAGFSEATSSTALAARIADTTVAEAAVGGLKPGTATIVAVADGHSARATVVVVPPTSALRMRRDTVRMHVGESTVLEATPLDRLGVPVVGRPMTWRSSDTTVATVSATGVVAARAPRVATIYATVDGATASAPITVRLPVGDLSTPVSLDVRTYDGSNQVVHPDVLRLPKEWNGHRYWMAITPYPNGNESLENPSIYASDDGENWEVPPGAVNPVAKVTGGHLSDPALVYDEPSNRLRLYYRDAIGGAAHARDDVFLTTSADGVKWSTPKLVYSDTSKYVLSPTLLRGVDGVWRSWAVDAGADGCRAGGAGVVLRTSSDGRKWTSSKPVGLFQPDYVPWHIDVQWVPARREYWALYAAHRAGTTCGNTDLFLATSADGVRWTTYPSPVLAHGAIPAFDAAVYRSAFLVDAPGDSATLWLSGARVNAGIGRGAPTTQWSAAISRTSVVALLARVSRPAPPNASHDVTTGIASAPDRMP